MGCDHRDGFAALVEVLYGLECDLLAGGCGSNGRV